MSPADRPAIAAVAAVSSLGQDWPSTWQALLAGRRAAARYCDFGLPLQVDAEVSGLQSLDRGAAGDVHRAATRLARLVLDQLAPDGTRGCRLYGASNHGETDVLLALAAGDADLAPLWHGLLIDPMPQATLRGGGSWICSACTSGLHALLTAVLDMADAADDAPAIVFAADALSAIGVAGFWRAGAVSRQGCRSFHESRDGLLVGEGAAAVQLRPSTAVSGQTISVLGIGTTCDAGHPTDPAPEGIWVERAARAGLAAAGITPKDVAAVVSHGTGTGKNDAAEAAAIRRLWPDGSIPVTSIKGALGHTMGAAGLFNILVANEAIRSGVLPPTVGDGSPVLCEIDLVRDEPREIPRGGAVIALASGFGGNNVACVLAGE